MCKPVKDIFWGSKITINWLMLAMRNVRPTVNLDKYPDMYLSFSSVVVASKPVPISLWHVEQVFCELCFIENRHFSHTVWLHGKMIGASSRSFSHRPHFP